MGAASEPGPAPRRRAAIPWRGLVWALLAALLASRLVAITTVAANWDELALLHRADQTAETGVFHSGGRPGLAVLALIPFVADCEDEIEVIRRARFVWLGISVLFLTGLGAWAAALQPDPERRRGDALLAVALLAAVPAFLEWSFQVRSDQIALAAGAWGGAALLASRRSPALALAAGALFGLGYLGTQKVVYVLALAGLLSAGALVCERELRPRREALRALGCLAGATLVVLAFRAALAALFDVPARHASQQPVTPMALERGASIFEFYRNTIGFRQYLAMLPTLIPHAALLAALGAATSIALRRSGPERARLALAWAVLAGGLAVGLFHAAAFAYFWMTLGLFPALAFALARKPIAELFATRRARGWATAALALALAVPAIAKSGELLSDTQAVQRESVAFVRRNLARSDRGFHPESGLFCQEGGPPIQTHFSQTIYRRFAGASREANTEKMIETFRSQPVKFMVQSFRLNQFPVELRRFWAEHYQPYRASVFLAGRQLAGRRGESLPFELIVSGRYRWIPLATGPSPLPIRIDGVWMASGETLELDAGSHVAHFPEDGTAGILVLAVDDPPGPAPLSFYKAY